MQRLCYDLSAALPGQMAELVDALDLGSSGVTRGSSTLPLPTRRISHSREEWRCRARLLQRELGNRVVVPAEEPAETCATCKSQHSGGHSALSWTAYAMTSQRIAR